MAKRPRPTVWGKCSRCYEKKPLVPSLSYPICWRCYMAALKEGCDPHTYTPDYEKVDRGCGLHPKCLECPEIDCVATDI